MPKESLDWIWLGWLAAIGFMICACSGIGGPPVEAILVLVLGWLIFIIQTLPNVHVNVGNVVLAVTCFAVFTVGAQAFLQWLLAHWNAGDTGQPTESRSWQWRWTLSLCGLIVLAFVSGIAMVGVVHQSAWLASSPKPLVGMRGHEAGRRSVSTNNERQIALGVLRYEEGFRAFPQGTLTDQNGKALHGWVAQILPFMDRSDLHQRIDFDQPWTTEENQSVMRTVLETLLSPSVPEPIADKKNALALTHYAGNVHVLGGNRTGSLGDITDGPGQTILLGEACERPVPWGSPWNLRDPMLGINASPQGFGAPHRVDGHGGAVMTFADGHQRFISNDIDPAVLQAVSTPRGGEAQRLPD